MHVRIRKLGNPETVLVVESKLTKIDELRRTIQSKFKIEPKLQKLFYGGKILENGYTLHDYNIKLNDVIQLMVKEKLEDPCIDKTDINTKDSFVSQKQVVYKDAKSTLYEVGDFIDIQKEGHGWLEGKIVKIVLNPEVKLPSLESEGQTSTTSCDDVSIENQNNISNEASVKPLEAKHGIARYFKKKDTKKAATEEEDDKKKVIEDDLLFKIQLDEDDTPSELYGSLKDIRPRARTEINVQDLKAGQKVMINHNMEDPSEKGGWYDFVVVKVNKKRSGYELEGTLYLFEDIHKNDMTVLVHDKLFAIETVVPLAERTKEYKKKISKVPEKRSVPLQCLTCRDVKDTPCSDCGCFVCSGKEDPDKIVLCDECDNGYHLTCLDPPLDELPDDDWYCPSCKRDMNDVIAPGASKQKKKAITSATKRDWGRGMACVGKTRSCAMPANHFGPIPGIEVGMCWRFRIQLSESGVHRPPVSGIHGRDEEGAYSIVLSGGYEDDVDNGDEFTYTGSGGRDLSGNKRTAEQSCDQTLTRENRALARNCAVEKINEEGSDAGARWKEGKPVRVVRSYKMLKIFPKYAPKEGVRYDGIYKVVKYYQETGLSGYKVWKYLLRRDDPNPAPWEPNCKEYPIVYPDGYLEAEAEKKALKEKKAATKRTQGGKRKNENDEREKEMKIDVSPPAKKPKLQESYVKKKKDKHVKSGLKISDILNKPSATTDQSTKHELTADETTAIDADTLNKKLWEECVNVVKLQGKAVFIQHTTQTFLCSICQDLPVNPVTTPCLHNFCMSCIKLAYQKSSSCNCPYCRHGLDKFDLQVNENLKTALRKFFAGYDSGKK